MKKIILPVFLLFFFPLFLLAHDSNGSGFGAGFTHPVLGLDHLLAMLSVGILSAQIGGKAIWTVPAIFVTLMLIGAIMGIGAEEVCFVETAIALSVIILGGAISLNNQIPIMPVMAAVGFFGFAHGFAHGVEMPQLAHPSTYALGFILGTTLIHIVGVAIGYFATKTKDNTKKLQFAGAFIAGMGLQILIG